MTIKNAFVQWQASYNGHESNQPTTSAKTDHIEAIKNCTATVSQLDRQGNIMMTYELKQVWCDNVSGTDVSYDTPDTISEFTVTLKYHSYTITGGDQSIIA